MMNLRRQFMLSSATMQTKRILSWFSVLESTNNVKYAGESSCICLPKNINIEHDLTVIEKIKMVQFFCPTWYNVLPLKCSTWWKRASKHQAANVELQQKQERHRDGAIAYRICTEIWMWFSMFFQDKTTLFSQLFKVFYTCLYKQNTLKTRLNAKYNFNAKH